MHNDTPLYEIAGKELESGQPDRGTFSKAYANASGDEKLTKALYIQYRVDQMKSASKQDHVSERVALSEDANNKKKQKTGGWLLFLCVCLTIINPILIFIYMASLPTGFQANGDLIWYYNIYLIGVIGYFLITGFNLWRQSPNAVWHAKLFFIVIGFSPLFAMMALALDNLSPPLRSQLIKDNREGFFYEIAWCIFWYQYLCRSKRVKATFIKA
jgi:hypothetical protein